MLETFCIVRWSSVPQSIILFQTLTWQKVQKFSTVISFVSVYHYNPLHYSHCNYKCAALIHLLLVTWFSAYLITLVGPLLYKRLFTWHQVSSTSLQNFNDILYWTQGNTWREKYGFLSCFFYCLSIMLNFHYHLPI